MKVVSPLEPGTREHSTGEGQQFTSWISREMLVVSRESWIGIRESRDRTRWLPALLDAVRKQRPVKHKDLVECRLLGCVTMWFL
jgi:hypothetical protein